MRIQCWSSNLFPFTFIYITRLFQCGDIQIFRVILYVYYQYWWLLLRQKIKWQDVNMWKTHWIQSHFHIDLPPAILKIRTPIQKIFDFKFLGALLLSCSPAQNIMGLWFKNCLLPYRDFSPIIPCITYTTNYHLSPRFPMKLLYWNFEVLSHRVAEWLTYECRCLNP